MGFSSGVNDGTDCAHFEPQDIASGPSSNVHSDVSSHLHFSPHPLDAGGNCDSTGEAVTDDHGFDQWR